MASRMVGRLTLKEPARSRSADSREPGLKSPDLMDAMIESATWRYSLRVSIGVVIAVDLTASVTERNVVGPRCLFHLPRTEGQHLPQAVVLAGELLLHEAM